MRKITKYFAPYAVVFCIMNFIYNTKPWLYYRIEISALDNYAFDHKPTDSEIASIINMFIDDLKDEYTKPTIKICPVDEKDE